MALMDGGMQLHVMPSSAIVSCILLWSNKAKD